MSIQEVREKTLKALNKVPVQEGVKQLMNLLDIYPPETHELIHMSCLGLLQMKHDWQNLRFYMIKWGRTTKLGSGLINRMRRRVNQQSGSIPNNQKDIVNELDRLFEKNWKINSPKKQPYNYQQWKCQNKINTKNIEEIINTKSEFEEKKDNKPKNTVFSRNSFNIPKTINQKNQNKQSPSKNPLRLKFGAYGFENQQQNKDTHPKVYEKINHHIQHSTQSQNLNSNKKNLSKQQQIQKQYQQQPKKQTKQYKVFQTPGKQLLIAKPKLKIQGNSIEKTKNKDDFSFSAIRSRHVPRFQSNQKQKQIKNDEQNSFFNFSEDQKFSRTKQHYNTNYITDKYLPQQFDQRKIIKQKQIQRCMRPAFTQQQMMLIQQSVQPPQYIKKIMQAQGISAMQLLAQRLSKV